MKKILLLILVFILKQSWSDIWEIPEGFFLYNYLSERISSCIETKASINHFVVNADIDSTFVLNNSLSYSGSVLVPFDKVLPFEEQHNLYYKKYGEHVSAALKGEFAFSKQEYQFTEAQSNIRPGENNYDYYIKSQTILNNHSVFRYGGSINTGFNWSNKTLLFLAGGSLIQNTGYTVTNDHDYYDQNLQLNIIDFDNKDISYSLKGGVLLSGKDFVLSKNCIYFIAATAEYTKTNTPIHESSNVLELVNSSITYQGAKARTQSLNFYFGVFHPSANDSTNSNGLNSKRLFSLTINSLQMQIHSFSDKISDYYLYSDNPNVIERTHARELYNVSFIIVPQITVLNNFKLQLKTGVAKDRAYSTTASIFSACIMSLSLPFKNGLVVTTTVNSGDFLLRIMSDVDNRVTSIYQAYSSSIALQLKM